MTDRPNPVSLAFGPIATERFPILREGITAAGSDPRRRDAFVLVREVVELLREMRTEDAGNEGIEELIAFTHAAYLFWLDGECLVAVAQDTLEALLLGEPAPDSAAQGRSYYLQVPLQRVWGETVAGAAVEPLDGCFVIPGDPAFAMVGVFGIHPGRDGLTVVTAEGPRMPHLVRPDRTPLFSPRLPGGARARLFQVVGPEELLELGYRVHGLLPATGAVPGSQQVSLR